MDERLISVTKSMYDGAMTAVKIGSIECKKSSVRLGVHQGSVVNPLIFIIVLEALQVYSLRKKIRKGLPYELLLLRRFGSYIIRFAESEKLLV